MPKRMLKNVVVLFLSLVDKGANKRKIFWKSDSSDEPVFEKEIAIVKINDEKQMVYGIVYAPDEEDSQGDGMTAEEIEKASQNFMKARRTDKVDQQHDFDPDEGFVAENWIIRGGDPLFPVEKEGSWAVGIKVENIETWQKVKDGEITGISMGGFANAETTEKKAVPFKAAEIVEGGWDASAATKRLRNWASSDGSGDKDTISWSKYRQGFAWYDTADVESFGSYKLPHHDVQDGSLVTNKRGVQAAAGAVQGARGGVSIPEGDMSGVRSHLAKHYHQWDEKAPWEVEKSGDTVMEKFKQIFSWIFSGSAVQKDFEDEFNRSTMNSMVWALQDALNKIMQDESITDKTGAIQESINQFSLAMETLKGDSTMEKQKFDELAANVKTLTEKAGEQSSFSEEIKALTDKIEKADAEKISEEDFNALQSEYDGLSEKVEKAEPPKDEPEDKLGQILAKLDDFDKRLEKVEKAHGGSTQPRGRDDDEPVEKAHKGFRLLG
jgi:hypothetical protein